ncbi:MAG: hypothetical protein OXM61_17280 [Candidatus Poribacteria bacterium]|nr:hypothetical protein [Candidatus Poribacteria bacterium]
MERLELKTPVADIILATSNDIVFFLYQDEEHFRRHDCMKSFSTRAEAEAFIDGIAWAFSEPEVEKKAHEQRLTQILQDFAEQVDDEEWKYVPIRICNTIELILEALGIPTSPERDNTQA